MSVLACVRARACVFSRLHACTRVHVGGEMDRKRGTVERGNELEHRDQLNFYSPFDFSVNAPRAEANT